MYWLVESSVAWPSTAEIVGNGVAARSILEAALCRRKRVPALGSATPAARNTVAVTRYIAA
jgi:hypothetical protein